MTMCSTSDKSYSDKTGSWNLTNLFHFALYIDAMFLHPVKYYLHYNHICFYMAYFFSMTESLAVQTWKLLSIHFTQLAISNDMNANTCFHILSSNFTFQYYRLQWLLMNMQALSFTLQKVIEFQSNNNLMISNKYHSSNQRQRVTI